MWYRAGVLNRPRLPLLVEQPAVAHLLSYEPVQDAVNGATFLEEEPLEVVVGVVFGGVTAYE